MDIAVTVNYTVQISSDDFIIKRATRLFNISRPIKDIFSWSNSYLPKSDQDDISRLVFSSYTGSSL